MNYKKGPWHAWPWPWPYGNSIWLIYVNKHRLCCMKCKSILSKTGKHTQIRQTDLTIRRFRPVITTWPDMVGHLNFQDICQNDHQESTGSFLSIRRLYALFTKNQGGPSDPCKCDGWPLTSAARLRSSVGLWPPSPSYGHLLNSDLHRQVTAICWPLTYTARL